MKNVSVKVTRVMLTAAALALTCGANLVLADASKDCMLQGTVQKGDSSSDQSVNVKFHSAEKYDQDSNCRVRAGEKMEFKMPADPRLQNAEPGSEVKFRYRTENDGSATTELLSVGT